MRGIYLIAEVDAWLTADTGIRLATMVASLDRGEKRAGGRAWGALPCLLTDVRRASARRREVERVGRHIGRCRGASRLEVRRGMLRVLMAPSAADAARCTPRAHRPHRTSRNLSGQEWYAAEVYLSPLHHVKWWDEAKRSCAGAYALSWADPFRAKIRGVNRIPTSSSASSCFAIHARSGALQATLHETMLA
jgi:hypothetical protein